MARSGCFVAIVGPSGSGKDTLINWLRRMLQGDRRVMFVRRAVTRDADASLEDHEALTRKAFAVAEKAERFAVTWDAHGLRYGIPVVALRHVEQGGIAIANGSRRALGDIERVFGNVLVVNLKVDRNELERRLAARGRETPADIAERLARGDEASPVGCRIVEVDNTGPVERAGETVLELLQSEFGPVPASLA